MLIMKLVIVTICTALLGVVAAAPGEYYGTSSPDELGQYSKYVVLTISATATSTHCNS